MPQGSQSTVTLRDIAAATGLSISTVSRVLSGNANVRSDRRDKILEAARTLDYRPDPFLRSLSSYRWKSQQRESGTPIAFLSYILPRSGRHDHAEMLADGVQKRARELGYALSLHSLSEALNHERLVKTLYNTGHQGVILSSVSTRDRLTIDLSQFCMVTAFYNLGRCDTYHHIGPDWGDITRKGVEECLRLGYRRIGFAHLTTAIDEYRTAYLHWEHQKLIAQFGGQPRMFYWTHDPAAEAESSRRSRKEFNRWYLKEKPEVVIASNEVVFWWMNSLNIEIPSDCGLLLLGNLNHPDLKDVYGVDDQPGMLGQRAVEMLDKLIRYGERGPTNNPVRSMVLGQLRPGKTLRQMPCADPSEN